MRQKEELCPDRVHLIHHLTVDGPAEIHDGRVSSILSASGGGSLSLCLDLPSGNSVQLDDGTVLPFPDHCRLHDLPECRFFGRRDEESSQFVNSHTVRVREIIQLGDTLQI